MIQKSGGGRVYRTSMTGTFVPMTEEEGFHAETRRARRSAEAESLRAFGARNKEPELRKLANLLVDSDRFGTSIAPALRSHSKYLRTRFRQQAQEKARKVGVKLIFPVFFLIFPSVLLVTLGPACIMMYQQLKTLLQ